MNWCLPKHLADDFRNAIKSGGDLSLSKLEKMDSESRFNAFSDLVGEEIAKKLNYEYERAFTKKDPTKGLMQWVRDSLDLGKVPKEELIQRIKEEAARKKDRIFNPKEGELFLGQMVKEAYSKKFKTEVSFDEAKLITEMASKVKALENSPNRMEYGAALHGFNQFVEALKHGQEDLPLGAHLKKYFGELKSDFSNKKLETIWRAIVDAGGVYKSAVFSFDNGVIGRHGIKVLIDSPELWAKHSAQSFFDIWHTLRKEHGDKEIMSTIFADALSRENARNGVYKEQGLDISGSEESLPSNVIGKIPLIGRLYRASETAMKAFLLRTRIDLFDKIYKQFKDAGVPTDGIGKFVNSITGRASLGKGSASATKWRAMNNLLTSPRYLKSNFDFLSAHMADKEISPALKKRALGNIFKTAGLMFTVFAAAKGMNALLGKKDEFEVEYNPLSSNFGKVNQKIAPGVNRSTDYLGGLGPVATLVARFITLRTKDAKTGKIKSLLSKDFGAKDFGDIFLDFIGNRMAPDLKTAWHLRTGQNREGEPYTSSEFAKDLMPLTPKALYETLTSNRPLSVGSLVAFIFDALGANSQFYDNSPAAKAKHKQLMRQQK